MVTNTIMMMINNFYKLKEISLFWGRRNKFLLSCIEMLEYNNASHLASIHNDLRKGNSILPDMDHGACASKSRTIPTLEDSVYVRKYVCIV